MNVTVDRPAAARRALAVVLRAAGLAAAFAAVGALLDRGTFAENGVDIGAGLLRIALLAVVVGVGAALDGRRRGFRWAGQVWTAVVAVLATASVVRILADGWATSPAESAGVAFGLLAVLGLPLVGLVVAGSAAGSALHGRPGGPARPPQVIDAA